MKAKLILVAGKADKNVIRLKLPTVVGRARDAGLMIKHPTVSRRHCEIFEVDGALFVRDTGSTNGTLVDDAPVQEAALKPGHTLTVGPLTFRAVYEYAGSPTLVAPLAPDNHQPDSPTVPSTADGTALAEEIIPAAIAAPLGESASDVPALADVDLDEVAAGESKPDLEFEELVQADLNAPAGESQPLGEATDAGATGVPAEVDDAEPEFAPLSSDDDDLELSFDEPDASPTTQPTALPPVAQSSGDDVLPAVAPQTAGDNADSGLELDLADDLPELVSNVAPPAAAEDEADELTFDLDEPLPMPEHVASPEVISDTIVPAEEIGSDVAAALPLEMDDDLELDFKLVDSTPASDAAAQPAATGAPTDSADDELTFELAEPEATSSPTPDAHEAELSLDDGEPEYSLEEVPAVGTHGTPDQHDDSELDLELELEQELAPDRSTTSAASPAFVDPADAAEELSFDVDEPDALDPAPNGEAKKKATVGDNDSDLDSFLKELGM